MSNEPDKPELPSDDEIEARFNKIRENLHPDLEEVDLQLAGILENTKAPEIETDEFDGRIDALREKADALKAKRQAQKAEVDRQIRSTQESSQGLGMGLTIAYVFLGVPLVGGLIGFALNKLTGGTIWIVIFGLGGMVVGVVYAMILLAQQNKQP